MKKKTKQTVIRDGNYIILFFIQYNNYCNVIIVIIVSSIFNMKINRSVNKHLLYSRQKTLLRVNNPLPLLVL